MGRFSSVQTYTDTASDKRTVPYEQVKAASSTTTSVQPEKVVNPYGSTAGAGSGEFHIYRQARAREMQRQAQLQLSAQEQAAAREFEEQRQRDAEECAARTEKRKRKREKQKEAKLRKRNLEQAGIVVEKVEAEEPTAEEEEEFVYISEPKEDVTTEKDGDESALNNAKATLESSRSEGAS
ncbi:hypothetical protein FisN_17Hh121 [Fistulifera solaris]|jgi:hypothetical protein|uniref:Uncharacterized protein n=1 Tax=Fistulifera solaris TaxID=1519565 RepID=A0A1Z5JHE8_FISSO|nr:hypothetical protein FisN_17Hh121 [Fistulifera solaris]|eukprot:GAX13191.1 hypothetical protein FisN_17Hh121 [Fistulifera solaris]